MSRVLPGNVKWYSNKLKPKGGKSRRHASPQQMVALRLADFARLFRVRYGRAELPDDDSGRDDIEPVLHHLAQLRQGHRRCAMWLELWAPWLTIAEQRAIISKAMATQRMWTADALAWRYRLTKEERRMLGIST